MTISQSYYIGGQNPGDVVIPVRMVLSQTEEVIVRCVALRDGGKKCDGEWLVAHLYRGASHGADEAIANILMHMELHHTLKEKL